MKFNTGIFFEFYYKTKHEVVFVNKNLGTITLVLILKPNKSIDFEKRPCVYVGDTYFKSHVTYNQVGLDMAYLKMISEWIRKSANKNMEVKNDAKGN